MTQARDFIATDLRHTFAALAIMMSLAEVQPALPGRREPHAMQVIANGDVILQTERQPVVDLLAKLRCQHRAEVPIARFFSFAQTCALWQFRKIGITDRRVITVPILH